MNLNNLAKQISNQKTDSQHPPVHLWNPDFCGDIDMVIKRDGSWHYMKSPIGRSAMVRLFASILKSEQCAEGDLKYFLVTPVEKVGIVVEDLPFITTDMHIRTDETGQAITFETNVGDQVIVGEGHDIYVEYNSDDGIPQPYVHIRRGLKARISRTHFYELVDHGYEEEGYLYIKSGTQAYNLGSLSE